MNGSKLIAAAIVVASVVIAGTLFGLGPAPGDTCAPWRAEIDRLAAGLTLTCC